MEESTQAREAASPIFGSNDLRVPREVGGTPCEPSCSSRWRCSSSFRLSAQEGELIASMDEMRFSGPKEKGSASLVDGKVGKAVRYRFEADAPGMFFTSKIHGRPEWDKADGSRSGSGGGRRRVRRPRVHLRRRLRGALRPLLPGAGEGMDQGDRSLAGPGSRAPRPAGQTARIAGRQPALEAVRHVRRQVVVLGRLPGDGFDLDEIRLEPKLERAKKKPKVPPARRSRGTLAKLRSGQGDHRGDDGRLADRQAALGQSRGLLGRPAPQRG